MGRNKFITLLVWLSVAVLLLAGCKKTGWIRQDDGLYYYTQSGETLSGWQEIDGHTFYFEKDGKAVSGFCTLDGQTYFFSEDGAMSTGWVEQEGKYYYFRSNGTMVTGWLSLEGARHYLFADGSAATGVRLMEGAQYVFDKTGRMCSGWADLGGQWAYGDSNCHPVTGWQEIDGRRYHFAESGILSTGWTEIDGFRYYFLSDGSPAQGSLTIEGIPHNFGSNGQEIVLVNPWNYYPDGYQVELVPINDEHQVAAIAYSDYLEMFRDCQDAGMQPAVCSSYRSFDYQKNLYNQRIQRYVDEGKSLEEATVLAGQSVAVPGTSEHHLGLALDIVDNRNWNLDESQAEMPTQKWLMENSWRYGWILRYPSEKSNLTGIIYEPWHYRYVGRELAAEIHGLGLCLEEYLDMLTEQSQ